MADLKTGVILEDGESLVMEIEAELWATSSNPIARFFGSIRKFFAMVFGTRRNGYIVITNRRVVEVSNYIVCYCFNVGREVKYVLPSSVKEVGYRRHATCGCFCPAYYFYYQAFTQDREVLLSGSDETEAQRIVDAFYKAISFSQGGNA